MEFVGKARVAYHEMLVADRLAQSARLTADIATATARRAAESVLEAWLDETYDRIQEASNVDTRPTVIEAKLATSLALTAAQTIRLRTVLGLSPDELIRKADELAEALYPTTRRRYRPGIDIYGQLIVRDLGPS